jgi:ribosomal protein S18 acetylase RimI-like enzyme
MDRSDISIQPAGVEDAVEVARLLHDFNTEFSEPTPPVEEHAARLAELFAAGEITVLLSGEAPDGVALLRFRPSLWEVGLEAYLEELYVVPARRGRGIGRALLERAMETARERGAVHFELTTGADDTAARGLYESAGFTNREGSPDGPAMLYYERDL